MIGLLIITHCRLAQELLEAAEFILGSIEAVDVVSIDTSKDSDTLRDLIEVKIQSLDSGKGVLVLTDMFGGTPSNLALSFLQQDAVEVVTGVNLPMVIAVAQNRETQGLAQIADLAKNAGCRSISLASELLKPTET
ncbi:MAG: PTS sugar transporter [Deltaproteobacteria bacterium]|jgi:PTS system mannose-specific IIA component|nr:PTS sugar transporter subunit IIA [Deltaproteobacteria bacterium]MBW2076427.1 PTS sugar transporter subunit IIA [Deltaproteobacteria bacterium]MBW2310775.1 PTS sugar transporter subunit IIA [Deltaproteobacteria bacterium]RLB31489.1 MAG: PTS sugar transporter [Deltaproteobacteria bacterium]